MLSCVSSHNNENNTNCYEGSTHYLMTLLGAAMHVFDFISAQNLKVIMTNDKEALQTKNNVGNCPTFGKKQAYQYKHNIAAINHIDEAVIIWVSFAATGPGYLAATESNMNTSVYRYLDSI